MKSDVRRADEKERMDVYALLPDDIQNHVRSFFYIWERFGIEKPVFQPSPDAYYLQIRHYDWDFVKKDHFFEYHRKNTSFVLRSFLTSSTPDRTKDYWVVQMLTRYQQDYDVVSAFVRGRLYATVPLPGRLLRSRLSCKHQLRLEFCVARPTRSSPPTRQASLDLFAEYVRTLSSLITDFNNDYIDSGYTRFYGTRVYAMD